MTLTQRAPLLLGLCVSFILLVEGSGKPVYAGSSPELVKDINLNAFDSSPSELTNVGGTLFFYADDGVSGEELWKSDGTAAGTILVEDIAPGTDSSSSTDGGQLTDVGGTLFFVANDGFSGDQLWKSDGTAAGTMLVKFIGPGTASPRELTEVGGMLFFTVDDGTHGRELWKSDGTAAGTVLVEDINPGSNSSEPASLTDAGGTLFFLANNGVNGFELWKSDGTAAGTLLVKDIRPGPDSSFPFELAAIGGTLYFDADDGTAGRELWKSDGTAAGTVLVKDIRPGSDSSIPGGFTGVGGTLFFRADDGIAGRELWKSDGTAAGTVLVKDIMPGPGFSEPGRLIDVGGTLLFVANDGIAGRELWRSDGSSAGTQLVKDIFPSSSSSSPTDLTDFGGTLFFTANDGTSGIELWKSDGTAAGTVLVKDIIPGSTSSGPLGLTDVGGELFMRAQDSTTGFELWKSDGTAAGTVRVKDIYPGSRSSNPFELTDFGGTLAFSAEGFEVTDNGTGIELWMSDGTSAGTVLVKDILPGFSSAHPLGYTNAGGTLYFSANDGTFGFELWKSDGTEAGTLLVKDIRSGSDPSLPNGLTNVGGTLYFSADDGASGRELWKSDGTAAGTVLVRDIHPGSGSSDPTDLIDVGGTLFFRADDGTNGMELWRSDGTVAGTLLVKDIHSGPNPSLPINLTKVGGTLYFSANNGTSGRELWKSDGTAAGTVLVHDIHPGSGSSDPTDLIDVGGTLYFSARDGTHGRELWRSDGTAAGTLLVKDINPGPGFGFPNNVGVEFEAVGGELYFNANDGANGTELWKSDGTPAGTVLVKDIHPGSGSAFSAFPPELTNVSGTLLFRAEDGTTGLELWESDGTAAGTMLVHDINPGSGSSAPASLIDVGGTLFFNAYDGVNGQELWKYEVAPAPGRIIIKKVTDLNPDPTATSFDFTLTGGETEGGGPLNEAFSLKNGEIYDTATLGSDKAPLAGTYNAAETVPSGWIQSLASCDDGSPVHAIDLQAGETVTCTFTNVALPSFIRVAKETLPEGSPATFDFTGDVTASLADGEASALIQVNPGQYSATETVMADWDLTDISCDDANSFGDTGAATATFNVEPGETVTCTFTNRHRTGTLTLIKTVVNDDGGTLLIEDFPLFMNGEPVTSGVAETFLDGTQVTASEIGQFGYAASEWGGDCASDGTVTIEAFFDKTCTITNDDIPPQLTIIKTVINDDGGALAADIFTINVSGTNVSPSSFLGKEAPGTTVTLDAGAYSVIEDNPFPNFYAVSYSADCSGAIGIGEEKTCTVTNDDIPALGPSIVVTAYPFTVLEPDLAGSFLAEKDPDVEDATILITSVRVIVEYRSAPPSPKWVELAANCSVDPMAPVEFADGALFSYTCALEDDIPANAKSLRVTIEVRIFGRLEAFSTKVSSDP